MPQIKINYIVSFSSEHKDHPASNLLRREIDASRRWTCARKGEPSASVVLQLERAERISSLTVGNHHSALVEVLVGRAESPADEFQVLVCANCFMNPADSRNSLNVSNVKTFATNQLVQAAQEKKWDRVRIVCKQPYNKHVEYGLSFIQLFNSDSVPSESIPQPLASTSAKMLGKFKLKDESDEDSSTSFKPGELFSKQTKQALPTDAQIRHTAIPKRESDDTSNLLVKANRPSTSNAPGTSKDCETLSRKRDKLMYIDDDDAHDEKIDSIIAKDREEKKKAQESDKNKAPKRENEKNNKASTPNGKTPKPKVDTPDSKPKVDKQAPSTTSTTTTTTNQVKRPPSDDSAPAAKKQRTDPKENIINVTRGDDCLRGVVFVISGYVNPRRSNLRDIAISLGARYCPDWNATCTHLICAFPNTPKHEQVKRSGPGAVVVTGEWLEECGRERANLPWRWFSTDPRLRVRRMPNDVLRPSSTSSTTTSNGDPSPIKTEDDEDTDDDIDRVLQSNTTNKIKVMKMSDEELDESDDDDEDPSTSSKMTNAKKTTSDKGPSSTATKTSSSSSLKVDDPYAVDTEEDEEVAPKVNGAPSDEDEVPDVFSGITFYVHDALERAGHSPRDLARYIRAYGGDLVTAWPSRSIDVAITAPPYADELRPAKERKCTFVRPEWVGRCHDTKSLFSCEEYTFG